MKTIQVFSKNQPCLDIAGEGVNTSLDDETIDWDFPVHPDKKITNLKKA